MVCAPLRNESFGSHAVPVARAADALLRTVEDGMQISCVLRFNSAPTCAYEPASSCILHGSRSARSIAATTHPGKTRRNRNKQVSDHVSISIDSAQFPDQSAASPGYWMSLRMNNAPAAPGATYSSAPSNLSPGRRSDQRGWSQP